jgi:hypothetical protein
VSRPSPFAVRLTASQRRVLEGRLRRPTAQQREVLRARIVLAAADGEQNIQIAGRLGVTVNTVSRWRNRFVEEGQWFGLMLAVAGREAGNPFGNPVVVTVPAGMQPGGRQTRLDLRRWATAAQDGWPLPYF